MQLAAHDFSPAGFWKINDKPDGPGTLYAANAVFTRATVHQCRQRTIDGDTVMRLHGAFRVPGRALRIRDCGQFRRINVNHCEYRRLTVKQFGEPDRTLRCGIAKADQQFGL